MSREKVQVEQIRSYYEDADVVDHYRRATANIGLWRSEESVFERVFRRDDRILELGTGTGRIAIGLAEIGYRHLLGIELSRGMLQEARRIARVLESTAAFQRGDATGLKFEDGLFDGAIFGFNGLMQIPGRQNRERALREIHRVVRPGGAFVFTTHDRQVSKFRKFWQNEQRRWETGKQKPELHEFGDRWEDTPMGPLYIHVPIPEEVRALLQATGWKAEWDSLRSAIATEPPDVCQFSDECRFWVARKPVG